MNFIKNILGDKVTKLRLGLLSKFEKLQIITEYLKESQNDEEKEDAVLMLKRIYEFEVIKEIKNTNDLNEKQRIYNEYVKDFLDGVEDIEESIVVEEFVNEEFIKIRNKAKKCEQYGIKYSGQPITIYEASEEMKHEIDKENRKRAESRLNTEITKSDLVLVRTTKFIPRFGIVESSDKHTRPEKINPFFDKEIENLGINKEEYETYNFISRRTSHWTLNGLVSSIVGYGDFVGRDCIIVEPFEEQINHPGLLSINEGDTFFEGDMKLSDKATLLMPLERYKEICKDSNMKDDLNRFNIVLFTGNEKIALQKLLQDQGYIYGDIGTWGFDSSRNNPEQIFAGKLEEVMQKEVERLKSEGRNVRYEAMHQSTESYKIDQKRLRELGEEHISEYVDFLAANSDVKFSPKYLKRIFKNRVAHQSDEKNHFLDDDITENQDLIKMSAKEVFERIGPERIKELTHKFNEKILEEHKQARKQKDEELLKKGLITKDDIERKTGMEI